MMNKTLRISLVFFFAALYQSGYAQETGYKAELDPEGRLVVTPALLPALESKSTESMTILDGYPIGKIANPTFKNQRGATLADIDNDGQNEIIFGANDSLFAYKADGTLLWGKLISGVAVLPVAVKDMDGDGSVELALNTAGLPPALPPGRVYLMDADGNDLEGWPKNFDDHWMISGPALADIDGDGVAEVITSERIGTTGHIHVLRMDGTHLNDNWPVVITGTPGFTPSVGDLDGDGVPDIVSGSSSTGALHAFDANGEYLPGFPQESENTRFSYQSPLLFDLDGDGTLDIVGARHGDAPEYFAISGEGEYLEGWPVAAPSWTYAPPSAVDFDGNGEYSVFVGSPITNTDEDGNYLPMDVIFGFNADGSDIDNFPIAKVGGNESVITVADINDDGVPDLVFTSNMIGNDGYGFIHAYSTDGSGELDGFPLRPRGWSFLQSALLDDVNGDGNLDLVALTHTSNFGADVDSIFVTAYDLGYPYIPENIYFNAYKGDNTRTGLLASGTVGLGDIREIATLKLYPNPGAHETTLLLPEGLHQSAVLDIHDATGKKIHGESVGGKQGEITISLGDYAPGIYLVRIVSDETLYVNKLMVE